MINKKKAQVQIFSTILLLMFVTISSTFVINDTDLEQKQYESQGSPVITSPYPVNGSYNQPTMPTLSITVNDSDGSLMNISFYAKVVTDYEISSPVIINKTKSQWANRLPTERKIWYANGRYWVFFGSNATGNASTVYSTSLDGETWTTPIFVCNSSAQVTGADFDSWLNDSTLSYAWGYAYEFGGRAPEYRMGTLEADGSIIWNPAGLQILNARKNMTDPTMCLNSTGYPFLGFFDTDGFYYPYVYLSDTKNGTWTTKSGYPINLHNIGSGYSVVLVPLLNGNVYAIIYPSSDSKTEQIRGKLWNNITWSSLQYSGEVMDSDYFSQIAVLGIDNDIHVIYKDEFGRLNHTIRNGTSGAWSSNTITTGVTSMTTPVIAKTENNGLVCIWGTNYNIYYSEYYGIWSEPQLFVSDYILNYNRLSIQKEEQNDRIGFTYIEHNDTTNYSLNYVYLEDTGNTQWTLVQQNLSVNNGTYTCSLPYANDPSATYYWNVSVNDGTDTVWKQYQFSTSDETSDWIRKQGYPNCTYGPPDFSQFQDNWWNLFDLNYCYCGPVAAANCLWWLDCKLNNNSNPDYFLPDNCGNGSKHHDNVMPFINWTAEWLNTSKQEAADDRSGTTSHNMTKGLYEIINYTNLSDILDLQTQGLVDEGIWQEVPNYTNVKEHLAQCDDVILLLGFYCYDGIGYSQRYGGHYVQVNGYNNDIPGLSFSDPFFDRAEDGALGWNSTHTHWPEPYTNGSHNWTVNVSYDYYWVNDSTDFEGGMGAFEIINYTDNSTNWTGQNWMNSSYAAETDCNLPNEIRTVAEQVWFIGYREGGGIEINKTVWNGTAWVTSFDAPVGTNATFNISIHNIGEAITTNLTIWDTYYDCLGEYQVGSSWILYPNGTRLQVEPNWTSYEPGLCNYAPHGHIGWYFDSYELENFEYCDRMYIEFNVSVNCSNYSKNFVECAICNVSKSGTDCLYNYTAYANATAYIGREFDTLIQCSPNLTENSTWLVSEHIYRPCKPHDCTDMNWSEYETEYERWMPYNTTSGPDLNWEWTYRYDNEDGLGTDSLNLSYTIVNDSAVNRSQSILRMRYNITDTGETDENVHIGIIYSYHNDSHFDMALFSTNSVLLLSKNETHLENTNDSSYVYDIDDAYNYWEEYWACNDSMESDCLDPMIIPSCGAQGIWAKTIWNQFCNKLQVKAWNITTDIPFALYPYEPSGWITEEHMKVTTADVTKGGADGRDEFSPEEVATVVRVYQGGTTYNLFDDYTIMGNQLDWFQAEDQPITSTIYNVDYISIANTKKPMAECFGLVVWQPPDAREAKFYADFDFIEMWKLNYSTDEQANATEVSQRPVFHGTGIPLMYFNAFNHTSWLDEIGKYYTNCEDKYNSSLITDQEYADCLSCVYQNISKKVTMNARGFNDVYKECGYSGKMDNQNDTIYYHSSIITNLTNQPYSSAMVVQIDVPPDGNYDHGDGVVMCVDVDNDQNLTVNDLTFVWWDWVGIGTHYTIYTGNESWSSGISGNTGIQARFYANFTEDAYNWSAINYMLPALHRYSGHRVYRAVIPTHYFHHDDIINSLQVNETFGLHIMTIDAGPDGVPPGVSVPVWENYNESSCLPLAHAESNGSDVWENYLNMSTLDEIEQFYFYQNWSTGLNWSQMQMWGHGRWGNETGELNTSFWDLNITKEANVTVITNTGVDFLVNYTFTICNTGDFPIHNVTVNDTFPPGVVYVSTNLSAYSVYEKVSGTWHFNITEPINASNCTSFNVTVNFTAGCAPNGTWINNFANVSCDEINTTDSSNISVKYGENTVPQINWTYPADAASGVSFTPTGLANISAAIYDSDGDTMNMYFFTNKTSTWDSGWFEIGTNITEGEGYNYSNQTFNILERYNTQWRWGATTYYWYANITDGKSWTNQSFTYTTGGSRYDVAGTGDVVSTDVSWAWNNRQGVKSYLGIYDVDNSGDIVSGDISLIWANRT